MSYYVCLDTKYLGVLQKHVSSGNYFMNILEFMLILPYFHLEIPPYFNLEFIAQRFTSELCSTLVVMK